MCHLRNVAMREYQESVTTGQTDRQTVGRTDRQTDTGQIDPYVPLCFAGDTKRPWLLSAHLNSHLIYTFDISHGSLVRFSAERYIFNLNLLLVSNFLQLAEPLQMKSSMTFHL